MDVDVNLGSVGGKINGNSAGDIGFMKPFLWYLVGVVGVLGVGIYWIFYLDSFSVIWAPVFVVAGLTFFTAGWFFTLRINKRVKFFLVLGVVALGLLLVGSYFRGLVGFRAL